MFRKIGKKVDIKNVCEYYDVVKKLESMLSVSKYIKNLVLLYNNKIYFEV